MNTLPLTRHQPTRNPRMQRVLITALAVLVIGLMLVIAALSNSSGAHAAKSTADRGQTLIHFYGNGTPPRTRIARPHTTSGNEPSQHFYGQQP
jgi:hypothetical protein